MNTSNHLLSLITLASLTATACTVNNNSDPPGPDANGTQVSRAALTAPAWPQETVRYRCENGRQLQAAYLVLDDGRSLAALYHDGKLSLMRRWRSDSGVRYVSLDEQVGLRWHIKGTQGTLSFLAADHTAAPIVLLSECRAVMPGG